MSLILAFGLSPLGQARAYADDLQAASPAAVSAIETQDVHTATLGGFTLKASDVTYDGGVWYSATDDRLTEDFVNVYTTDEKTGVMTSVGLKAKTSETTYKAGSNDDPAGTEYFADNKGTPVDEAYAMGELIKAGSAYTTQDNKLFTAVATDATYAPGTTYYKFEKGTGSAYVDSKVASENFDTEKENLYYLDNGEYKSAAEVDAFATYDKYYYQGTATAYKPADELKSFLEKATKADLFVKVVTTDSTGLTYKDATSGQDQFTLEYQDENGKAIKDKAEITAAGTYKAVLKGLGGFKGETAVATFQVKPYSFDDVVFDAATLAPPSIAYMGKPVAVQYAAGKYPVIRAAKDSNDMELADVQALNESTGKKASIGSLLPFASGMNDDGDATANPSLATSETNPGTLVSGDFDFDPPTVTERGNHTVSLVGKGNFTGTKATRVSVGQGVFATKDNLTVNGAVNSEKNYGSGYTAKTATNPVGGAAIAVSEVIDLDAAGANPTVGDPDPAATGKVIFGQTKLTKDSDYTVTYYKGDPDGTALKAMPTEVAQDGDFYYAVIQAVSTDFAEGVSDTVTVKYRITMGSELDEVARIADFGTTGFVQAAKDTNFGEGGSYELNAGERKFSTPEALAQVDKSAVKFYSPTGTDVSSSIGDNFEVVKVEKWDATLEKELLGEDGYKAKYPYSDAPYTNTDAVNDLFDDKSDSYIGDTEKLADSYTLTTTITTDSGDKENSVKTLGFNGLPAGDYKLTVEGAKNFSSKGKVYGKLTVAPATAVEGSSAGQLRIQVGHKGTSADGTLLKGGDPVIDMRAGVSATSGDAVYTQALKQGSAYQVRTGTADYYVTYYQDGVEVTPEEDGTYDAVFTFGGNNYASGTVEKAGALVVGKAELSAVADWAEVATKNAKTKKAIEYQYSGGAVEPTLNFYKVKDGAVDATASATATAKAKQAATAAGKTSDEIDAIEETVYVADVLKELKAAYAATKKYDDTAKKYVDKEDADYASDYTALKTYVTVTQAANIELVSIDKENYEVTYRGRSSDTQISGGKAVGPGVYNLVVKGAGKYTTTVDPSNDIDESIYVTASSADAEDGSGFTIAPLDLANENDYYTVQFKDGDEWTEDYSVVADGTQPKPEYRLVTTASKNKANPVVIPSGLYKGTFDYSQLNAADKTGLVGLNLKADDEMAGYVKKGSASEEFKVNEDKTTEGIYFSVAAKSFSDESVAATIVTSTAAGDVKDSGEYEPAGQDLYIKVVDAAGNTFAPQYSKTAEAQYVWTVKSADGKSTIKSTQYADEAAALAALKSFVKNAGDYEITISGGNSAQYAGKVTGSYKVTPKEIKSTDSKLKVTFNKGPENEFDYQGSKWTAIQSKDTDSKVRGDVYYESEDKAKNGGIGSEDGYFTATDDAAKATGNKYVIEGNTGTDAGTYTAKITFAGNYTGTVEKTWVINPVNIGEKIQDAYAGKEGYMPLADDLMLWNGIDSLSTLEKDNKKVYTVDYDGSAHEPTAIVYNYKDGEIGDPVKGLTLTYLYKYNTDATPDRYGNVQTGAEVTLVASGGNYTGRATLDFAIKPLSIGGDRVKVSFDNDDLTYTGQPVEPKGTLTYTLASGKTFTLDPAKDYTVTYSGDNVNVGGAATAKFTGLEPNFVGGKETFVLGEFSVQENKRAEQTITYLGEKAITKKVGDAAFKLAASTNATDGKVEFASSDAKVATVDDSGNVVIVGKGTATITISAAATKLFNAATPVEVKLTVNDANAAPAAKSANTLKIAKAKYKVKGVSKAKKTVAGAKVKVKGQGNVTWKKVKVLKGKKAAAKNIAKKVKVNKKTGKIVLKKGLKKGTYKVTVSAQAAGDATHEASKVLKAVVTLKVKK